MSDTKLVTIEVTEQDLTNGKRSDAARCPVARATRRTLRGAVEANGMDLTLTRKNGLSTHVTVPKRVNTFIDRFDCGTPRKTLKPFSFRVRVPTAFVR